MTADEKNHVISNANDELDRQLLRFDTVFPEIANEISDESRLGSLTHWAYTNRNTAKATANERPRREAASHKHADLAHHYHDADAVSRSDARREAAALRKQRRAQMDPDFEDARRKGHGRARGGAAHDHPMDHATGTKRRKVERPPAVDTATAMERSASGAGSSAGRNASKDGVDGVKKRARAPNAATGRKRYGWFVLTEIGLTTTGTPVLLQRILPSWRLLLLLERSTRREALLVQDLPHRPGRKPRACRVKRGMAASGRRLLRRVATATVSSQL